MKDVTVDDAPLVKQYQEAIEAGDPDLAQTILSRIPDGSAKLIRAEFFNDMADTCVAIQETITSGFVPGYVVSDTQPTTQKTGDLWFKITGTV